MLASLSKELITMYTLSAFLHVEKTTNEILDKKIILQRLEDIKKLCSLSYFEAACLLSWSTIEAGMRSKLTKEDFDESNKPTSYIIKTVYSYGLINLNDYKRLEKMYMIRNNIIHGFNQFVTTKDIEELNDIVLYLIGEGFVYDMLNWVEGLDLDHYEDIYALYCTVNNKENFGLFSYEEYDNEILIRADHIDDELILISDEQRKRLADLIEEEYMGNMDPEGWYGYNRALEKGD